MSLDRNCSRHAFPRVVRQQLWVAEVHESHHLPKHAVVALERLAIRRYLRFRLAHHMHCVVGAPVVTVSVQQLGVAVVWLGQGALLDVHEVWEQRGQVVSLAHRLEAVRQAEVGRAVRLQPDLCERRTSPAEHRSVIEGERQRATHREVVASQGVERFHNDDIVVEVDAAII